MIRDETCDALRPASDSRSNMLDVDEHMFYHRKVTFIGHVNLGGIAMTVVDFTLTAIKPMTR